MKTKHKEKTMKDLRYNLITRPAMALVAFISLFVLGAAAPNAHAQQQCSVATLRGLYGFHALATVVPAGTPRTLLGMFNFDGHGTWSLNLTVDDNGIVHTVSDGGTYIVNPDCTGALNPASGGTVAIVIVDDGREIYQMRTVPGTIVLYSTTKKVFPGLGQ